MQFHSAVRVSLHPTALRVFHVLFAVGRGSNVRIGQKTGWNVIHDRRSSAFNVFVLDSKMAKQAPKMGVEICHRTGAIGRDLPSLSLVRRLDSCGRMFGCLPGCSETFKG